MRKVVKVSVSVDAEVLEWLRELARREGRSLSDVFGEAIRPMRQVEGREEALAGRGDSPARPWPA